MTDGPIELVAGARRGNAVQRALQLELITIARMTVEASGAIVAGLVARSTLLLAFGIDSVIELVSAGVLYRRLRLEATGADTCKVEATEVMAGRIGVTPLFVLAAYVLASSTYKRLHRGAAPRSGIGPGHSGHAERDRYAEGRDDRAPSVAIGKHWPSSAEPIVSLGSV